MQAVRIISQCLAYVYKNEFDIIKNIISCDIYKLTSIVTKIKINVTMGVGVGNITSVCSCTNPPVINAGLTSFSQPKYFHITDSTFSAPIYRAQALAAQYECTKPLLNGNIRKIT